MMLSPANPIFDLAVIGAGPAGMAAASDAANRGLSVAVFDENPAPGGQIYRNVGAPQNADRSILGPDYFYGSKLVETVLASKASIVSGATVWMVQRDDEKDPFSVGIMRAGAAEIYAARTVLIATGALERPFPIRGWTLPGVITAGAAQTMLKASGVVPEGRTVLAGTGPLLYLLAAQFARAGVPLAAVLDTTPHVNWLKALPHAFGFLASAYFRKGLSLLGEVQRSTRIVRNVDTLEAEGDGRLSTLAFKAGGRTERLEIDTLLLHQGVVPQVNLAMAAGAAHAWNEERLAFEPTLDTGSRSSVKGLFIAGDSSGIGGALAAETMGRIAALHIAADLERPRSSDKEQVKNLEKNLARVLRGRRFIDALYRPRDCFRMPADDVVICRCEEVTAGAVRAAAVGGAQGPNQTKTFLRTGMGPCQGRLCGLTVTELMSNQLEKTPDEVGHFHIRNPVKPITLGALAALKGESETTRLF